jgi:Icc-related predicted phosphoesterase
VRILLVSDLHYTLRQFDWVVAQAPRHDLVVLAGDHLDIASAVPLEAQSVVVLRYLALLQAQTRVAAASGNHDLTGPDAQGEQAALWLPQARQAGVHVDGQTLRIGATHDASGGHGTGDTLVSICPWWDGPQGQAALRARLAAEAAMLRDRPTRWIWIYHWPPLGSPTCWTGRRHYGDADLGGWIAELQPDLVLTGHVHEPPFKPAGHWADRIGRTWVLNAGRQIGPVPAHVVVDLDAGTAEWHSMMGSEALELAAPAAPPRTVF